MEGPQRCSVRELRKHHEQVTHAFEASDESCSPSAKSPQHTSTTTAKNITELDRHYYWSRMTQLIRIQKWWKAIHARRLVQRGSLARRDDIIHTLNDECAIMIQTVWRYYKLRKICEKKRQEKQID